MRRDVLTGEYFAMGDVACAEGAIAAGCRFFAGYPITPATEVAEHMAVRLPEIGGVYLQMEDELASMIALIGASYAGFKAMTSTSGPGFSLMQENIGLAVMTETPCVVVNIMRGGPSTGQPTKTSQQDVMQAKWGSHGDYEIIALAPSTIQEMFDFTIEAFNYSEIYRCPVFLMADEIIGHLREKLMIPSSGDIELIERKKPKKSQNYLPFKANEDLVPSMACFGEGLRFYATGLTHDETGHPQTDSFKYQEWLVKRLCDKIRKNKKKIVKTQKIFLEDADVCVIAYGSVFRSALSAVKMARNLGFKAGILRPITLWPFPDSEVEEVGEMVEHVIVAEMNYGQILREVERRVNHKKITFIPKLGENLHTPKEILLKIKRAGK
ncbi:MAG: 2-oxoacid:acceptor oxidoreductase subunit alpha [Candidatus Methanofastidiosia archaeon]